MVELHCEVAIGYNPMATSLATLMFHRVDDENLSEKGVRLSLVHPLSHTKFDWH